LGHAAPDAPHGGGARQGRPRMVEETLPVTLSWRAATAVAAQVSRRTAEAFEQMLPYCQQVWQAWCRRANGRSDSSSVAPSRASAASIRMGQTKMPRSVTMRLWWQINCP